MNSETKKGYSSCLLILLAAIMLGCTEVEEPPLFDHEDLQDGYWELDADFSQILNYDGVSIDFWSEGPTMSIPCMDIDGSLAYKLDGNKLMTDDGWTRILTIDGDILYSVNPDNNVTAVFNRLASLPYEVCE